MMNDKEDKGQILAYIRVSTTKQNTARQEKLKEGADKVYEEKVTGKNTERPQLEALLDYAREGDLIRVWSIDRLARSLADLVQLVSSLTEKGVSVEFVKEGLTFKGDNKSSLTSYDRLQFNMLAAIAQFERELMLERQAEGIAKAKAAGKYKGRQRRLTDAQVLEIKERRDSGVTISRLCKDYEVGRTTIWNELKKLEAQTDNTTTRITHKE